MSPRFSIIISIEINIIIDKMENTKLDLAIVETPIKFVVENGIIFPKT